MTQGDECLAATTCDRRVGDREGVGVDPAPVVAGHDRLGDLSRRVGDELAACGRELGEVVGECRDECPERAGIDGAAGGSELRRGEVLLLDVSLELGAHDLDAAADAGADLVEQLLAPRAAAMAEHERRGLGRLLEVLERVGEEVVARAFDRVDADESRLAEERRAREGEQLAATIPVGFEIVDLERGVLGAQEVAEHAARAFGEDALGAGDQHHWCRSDLIPRQLRDRRRPRSRRRA